MLLVKGGGNAASVLALGKSRRGQGFASGSLEIQIQQCTLHFRSQGFLSLKSRFTDSLSSVSSPWFIVTAACRGL